MKVKKFIVGPLNTNCYLVGSGTEAVIIDPGGDVDEVIKSCGSLDVRSIILTHYHFDHVIGIPELKKEFPFAKVLIHQADKDYLDFEVDGELKDGDIIKFGKVKLKVLHTPGHSAGGICLLGDKDIFTGDTIFADEMIGRTDLPGSDPVAMSQSLEKLRQKIKPGMQAHPGHGREFIV